MPVGHVPFTLKNSFIVEIGQGLQVITPLLCRRALVIILAEGTVEQVACLVVQVFVDATRPWTDVRVGFSTVGIAV